MAGEWILFENLFITARSVLDMDIRAQPIRTYSRASWPVRHRNSITCRFGGVPRARLVALAKALSE